MSLSEWRKFLLYSTIINYGFVILWFVILKLPHDWIYQFSSFNVAISAQDFDKINLLGIALYKSAVILFNLVPCIVLHLIRDRKAAQAS